MRTPFVPRISDPRGQGVALLGVILLTLLPMAALAAWPSDGAPVGTGVGDQTPATAGGTSVCHDGVGGVISAYRTGTAQIRIDRLDGLNGARQWNGSSGVQVTSTAGGPPHVVGDGQGGAWVAWYDTRTTGSGAGLYIQHYDVDGTTLFFNGRRVSGGAATDPLGNHIDVDVTSAGHLIVAWQGAGVGIWVQRILLSGSNAAFAKVSTDLNMSRIQVMADGEGSVVTWACARGTDQGIWANRVTSSGFILWGSLGTRVMNRGAGPAPAQHTAAWDGANLFVAWSYQPSGTRTGLRDVYAQRIDFTSNPRWGSASTGLAVLIAPFVAGVTSSPQKHTEPQVVADGSGGCYVTWRDERDFHLPTGGGTHNVDLYGQHLDVDGVAQWTGNGKGLDRSAGTQDDAKLVSDGAGAAILVYMSYLNSTRDIWAKQLTSSGGSSWTRQPASTGGEQEAPMIAADGLGGVVIAWEDDRSGDVDTYAAHLGSNGNTFVPSLSLTSPNGGEYLLAGTTTLLQWSTNLAGNVSLQYERAGFTPVSITASTPNDGEYIWTVPNLPSPAAQIILTDESGELVDISDSPFVMCDKPFDGGLAHSGLVNARDLAVGDFNEDGDLDLAVAVGDGVAVAKGFGNRTFDTPFVFSLGASGYGVVSRDFNEDGHLDLAVSIAFGVAVLPGMGDGGFGTPVVYSTGSKNLGLASADLDEDGIADLVVAHEDLASISVLRGKGTNGVGDGTFDAPFSYATGAKPTRIVVADFSNDGILDLAVSCEIGGEFTVLLGQGNASFTVTSNGWAVNSPRGLATGDFDEDGNADIATGNGNASISICLGNGDGTFAPPVTYAGEGGNTDFAVGDFTGDGRTDLVASASTFNQMSLYAGNGTGSTGNGTFRFIGTYATGSIPEAIEAADFDGDGQVDLMTANRGTRDVYSLAGGLGTCQAVPFGLTMVSPNGGEVWPIGSNQTISWLADAGVTAVNVEVSRNGGANWELLAQNVTGSSWEWTVTGPATTELRVRVVDPNIASRVDASNANASAPTPTAVEPLLQAPARLALHPVAPNPFNPSTTIRFDLPAAGPVSLRIYDVAGRRVSALLEDARFEAGSHRVVWNGTDDHGIPVSSGPYLVRLEAEGRSETGRAVLVK